MRTPLIAAIIHIAQTSDLPVGNHDVNRKYRSVQDRDTCHSSLLLTAYREMTTEPRLDVNKVR